MLDNQTRMRSMLDLIESVDQGKKIKLNESYNGSLDEGPYTRLNTYRIKGQDMIDYLANEGGAQVEMVGDEVGILTVDIISFPELAKLAANLAQQGKITPVAGPATRDMTGKGVFSNIKYPMSGIDESSGSSSDVEELANDALDAAALSIQNALGVEHGDFAGTFFTGEAGDTILEILKDYAREEMKNQSEESDSEIDEGMIGDVYNTLRAKNYDRLAARSDSKSVSDGEMSPGPNWAIHQPIAKQRTQKAADIRRAVSDKKEFEKSGGSTDQIKDLISANNIGANYKESKDLKLKESGEGNSSSREKAIDGEGYDKWDPKHPNFAKKYKKYKTSNPEGTLKSFIAHLKKGALAEGVRLNKFRQVADILKTLPENNRKILAKRHCKIFENHNPRFNSKKFMNYIGLNEDGYGNGEIEVNFINSGHGTTLGMKKVQAGSITLDNYGRPVMKVSSPFDAGNTLMANFDSKTGGWVVDLD